MASYSQQYAEIIYPDRTRVLGVLLKPLTIGHALLLWRINSPLMIGGKFDRWAIVRALYILSRPCTAASAGLQRRRTRRLLELWAWQLRFSSKDALVAAFAQLSAHIEASFCGPDLWEDDEAGAKCGAPYLQSLKTRLMECLGVTRAEALDFSVREAIWDIAGYAEDHGRAEWVSAEEAATIESLSRLANN